MVYRPSAVRICTGAKFTPLQSRLGKQNLADHFTDDNKVYSSVAISVCSVNSHGDVFMSAKNMPVTQPHTDHIQKKRQSHFPGYSNVFKLITGNANR